MSLPPESDPTDPTDPTDPSDPTSRTSPTSATDGARPPLSPYELASSTTQPAPAVYGPPTTPSIGETHEPGVQVPHPTAPWAVAGTAAGPIPVSLWLRSSAFILDFFLTFVAVLVIVIVGLTTGARYFADGLFGLFVVPWIAIALNTVGVWLLGNTLGQRMARLRVVDAVTGERLGLGRTLLRTAIIVSPLLLLAAVTYLPILRYLGYYSNGPSVAFMVVFLWITMLIVASASGRSLHDRAANSTVIRV